MRARQVTPTKILYSSIIPIATSELNAVVKKVLDYGPAKTKMTEEKAPKIDFKALETITKKVLAHKPKKQVSGESKNDNK